MKYFKRKQFKKIYKKNSPWWKIIRQEFELVFCYLHSTPIEGYEYEDDNVSLSSNGLLCIKKGFTWGASGPTFDTESSRRGSCVHDALYYLSQKGVFDGENSDKIKNISDNIMYDIIIEDGMFKWRADIWFGSVQMAGHSAWNA